jgi:cell division protein FtsI (penicillin-binding protein 3)
MLARVFRWVRPGRRPRAGGDGSTAEVAMSAPAPVPDRPAEPFDPRWRGMLKQRVIIVLSVLCVWTAGIEARLIHLQIFRHRDMVKLALHQQHQLFTLKAPRGDLVDRHGNLLAYSVAGSTVVADPEAIDDADSTAAAVCQALGDCTLAKRASLLKSLTKDGSFAFLSRQVSPEQASRIDALKLDGVRIMPEPRRYYPKVELAAHVLGFVGVDNIGLAGVERAFDKVIRGRDGLMQFEVDARRKRMDSKIQQVPEGGATVELTIDLYLQHIAERELRAGVEESKSRGGTAIVMDPYSGEIFALTSYPTFNPNAFQQSTDEEKRNRAIQDVYEPGSTFKIVTASAAFEEHVLKIDDLIDTNPGVITFPGRKPITEDKHHNYGVLSVEDVVVKSSNIGAIKIGLRVGADRMSRYIRRFGFGQTLLPDLRGESQGIVWNPAKLTDSALASMSMGYQVGVTPLQMVSAASVVANGGTLYEPHLVRAIVHQDRREVIPPKPLRRVISPETAAMLTTIMEGVVERGTGKKAALDDYQVAGKTGTAAKLVDGHYSHTDYNVSFVGFVPSRRPAFAILVVVDTPHNGSPYGGTVAAPIFHRIAEAALRQAAVPATINPPPVILASDTSEEAPPQIPGPAVGPAPAGADAQSVMPDVRGKSAREALRVLGAAGLSVQVSGSGLVATQSPDPGQPIATGDAGVLELRRTLPAPKPATVPARVPAAGDAPALHAPQQGGL